LTVLLRNYTHADVAGSLVKLFTKCLFVARAIGENISRTEQAQTETKAGATYRSVMFLS